MDFPTDIIYEIISYLNSKSIMMLFSSTKKLSDNKIKVTDYLW